MNRPPSLLSARFKNQRAMLCMMNPKNGHDWHMLTKAILDLSKDIISLCDGEKKNKTRGGMGTIDSRIDNLRPFHTLTCRHDTPTFRLVRRISLRILSNKQ